MSKRILLLEHNAPILSPPSAWSVELVTPEPFSEDLIESYISESENRFSKLSESLLSNESLTEEQARNILASFKDQFSSELREAHQHKRMRVAGPAQIENEPNGNGRVYPTKLWDNVLSEDGEFATRLSNRQVLGELEHPCFTSPNFRVLTCDRGWQPYSEIREDEEVWSRVGGKAVRSRVNEVINESYSGPAYRVKSRSIDSEFTPGHRFLLLERPDQGNHNEVYHTIEEIASSQSNYRHSPVPKQAVWDDSGASNFIEIPGFFGGTQQDFRSKQEKPFVLPARLYAAFIGIYLAEGGCVPVTDHNYSIEVFQTNEWSKKYIFEEVLSKFPDEIQWAETKNGFRATDARLHTYLSKLGNVYTKCVPEEVKELSAKNLKELLFWFAIGDGRVYPSCPGYVEGYETPNGLDKHYFEGSTTQPTTFTQDAAVAIRENLTLKYTLRDLHSVSEQLIRGLHECLVRAGGCAHISRIDPKDDYEFDGMVIKAENQVPLWQLRIDRSANLYLDPRFTQISKVWHEGRIHCLSVTHGNFYVEQNGKSFWTGNSSGNTKLPRVSHLVEKVWRDKGVIYAQHLIFRTPNGQIIEELYRAGAVPGVSSRGAGSTSHVDGVDVVEASDFHLDTWDFVAQPSVFTARPSKIGESDAQREVSSVSERAIPIPTFVNPVEQGGERTMPQKITVESTKAIVAGHNALQASESYLNAQKSNLAGLLENQQAVVSALSGLGQSFPDEQVNEARDLRAKLGEHASTLRREIQRVVAEDDPDPDKDGEDDSGMGTDPDKDKDKDKGKGAGNGTDTGSEDNMDDATKENLLNAVGLESLENASAVEVIEALAAHNYELQRQIEGHVPEQKYRVAIDLGEAVVARANKDRGVLESEISKLKTTLSESQRLADASRTLLEATITQYRGEKVANVVETLIDKNPALRRIESRLRECKDEGELRSLLEHTIKPLVEGSSSTRTDLPPVATPATLLEDQVLSGTSPVSRQRTQPSGGQPDLMSLLAEQESDTSVNFG